MTVEVGVETLAATARILNGAERDAAFAAIVAEAPSAGEFEAKAGRTIRDRAGTADRPGRQNG